MYTIPENKKEKAGKALKKTLHQVARGMLGEHNEGTHTAVRQTLTTTYYMNTDQATLDLVLDFTRQIHRALGEEVTKEQALAEFKEQASATAAHAANYARYMMVRLFVFCFAIGLSVVRLEEPLLAILLAAFWIGIIGSYFFGPIPTGGKRWKKAGEDRRQQWMVLEELFAKNLGVTPGELRR